MNIRVKKWKLYVNILKLFGKKTTANIALGNGGLTAKLKICVL